MHYCTDNLALVFIPRNGDFLQREPSTLRLRIKRATSSIFPCLVEWGCVTRPDGALDGSWNAAGIGGGNVQDTLQSRQAPFRVRNYLNQCERSMTVGGVFRDSGARCTAMAQTIANRAALPGICRLKSTDSCSAMATMAVIAPARSQ